MSINENRRGLLEAISNQLELDGYLIISFEWDDSMDDKTILSLEYSTPPVQTPSGEFLNHFGHIMVCFDYGREVMLVRIDSFDGDTVSKSANIIRTENDTVIKELTHCIRIWIALYA